MSDIRLEPTYACISCDFTAAFDHHDDVRAHGEQSGHDVETIYAEGSSLDGATSPGEPNAYPSTPGEFAARWNAMTEEDRAERVLRIVESAELSVRWIVQGVPQELARLRALVQRLNEERLSARLSAASAAPIRSMTVEAIRDDIKTMPGGRGGEVRFTPATPNHGALGCPGDNLLADWDELALALASERAKTAAEATHFRRGDQVRYLDEFVEGVDYDMWVSSVDEQGRITTDAWSEIPAYKLRIVKPVEDRLDEVQEARKVSLILAAAPTAAFDAALAEARAGALVAILSAAHVPTGPVGIAPNTADADYMASAASHLRKGYKVGGSGVTAAVARVLDAVAEELRAAEIREAQK